MKSSPDTNFPDEWVSDRNTHIKKLITMSPVKFCRHVLLERVKEITDVWWTDNQAWLFEVNCVKKIRGNIKRLMNKAENGQFQWVDDPDKALYQEYIKLGYIVSEYTDSPQSKYDAGRVFTHMRI